MQMIMSYSAWTLLFTVLGYEVQGLYSMARLSVGGERAQSSSNAGCAPACDLRSCPVVTVETCPGRIVSDQCQCCPVCNTTQVISNNTRPTVSGQTEDEDACAQIECPRQQMCLLNIQGIPVCRCPSSVYCRNRPRKLVCSTEGVTYKSMCLLKMQACEEDRRIGLRHKGPCEGSKEAAKQEKREQRQEKTEKQGKRDQRLEKIKKRMENKDKKKSRKNQRKRKLESRKQRKEERQRQRNGRQFDELLPGNKPDKNSKVNGRKERKEEQRQERRRHRRHRKRGE